MDFEPYFKDHNLVNVFPKIIKLGQMTNLNMIFYVIKSVYRFVKIWNSPQFPVEFRNGLFVLKIQKLSHIMAPTPILEMARAYDLRPWLWLLL